MSDQDGQGPDAAPTKRQRGELEVQIKAVTDDFCRRYDFFEDPTMLLTPARIAEEIEKRTGIPASEGSIARHLTTWQNVGFAILLPKPLAFLNYSAEAEKTGLREMKKRYKELVKEAAKGVAQNFRLRADEERHDMIKASKKAAQGAEGGAA